MATIIKYPEFDARKSVYHYIEASLDYVRVVEHKLAEVLNLMDNLD